MAFDDERVGGIAGPGRSTIYTDEIGREICRRISEGESLRAICRDRNMPHEATARGWALIPEHPFFTQYAQAREIAYHSMADEVLEIADDGSNDWMERNDKDNPGYEANGEHMQRSRLRVDSRKWVLSKMLPKLYGDRQGVDMNLNGTLQVTEIKRTIVDPRDSDA